MPHTLAALTAGQISEWRATLLVRETACLTRADPQDFHNHHDPGTHDPGTKTTAHEPVHVPAFVPGYGPVPAPLARDWLRQLLASGDAPIWLSRVFTRPDDGTLVTMDSTRRAVTGRLAAFLTLRDQHTCRTPWCGAPLRHLDHPDAPPTAAPPPPPTPKASARPATLALDTPGWHTHVHTDQTGTPTVTTTTPTGHTYTSHPPPPPRRHPPRTPTHKPARHRSAGTRGHL